MRKVICTPVLSGTAGAGSSMIYLDYSIDVTIHKVLGGDLVAFGPEIVLARNIPYFASKKLL